MPEQRKMITALFCDLVGSTELSGVLEPETLRAVVLRYFEAMRAGVEARGGTVEKFIGDAVVAVFGVPRVREDDARRAAAAALDMIAALKPLNEELAAEVGSTLEVRIGVNSGEVVTSGEATDGTFVSGEVVNVAARLEQAAPPGEILIGPATRLLLGAEAEVAPLGPLRLKGKREPVRAFRLLGLAPRGAGADTPPDATPLVGREAELRRLTEHWKDVTTGPAARLVTVTGEAGIGKTRLLRAWLAQLAADGVPVGAASCRGHGDEASLAPLADALTSLLRHTGVPSGEGGAAHEVLRGGLLVDGTPSPSTAATWGAVGTLLAELSRRRPLALVLDDAQWARPALLRGLRGLRETLADRPVLLLHAGRPTRERPPLAADFDAPDAPADPDAPAHHLPLGPLPEDAARRLAASQHLVGRAGPLSSGVREAAIRRAEGNPLHLEQLLAWAADGGDATDPGRLPVTVTAVLAARIDGLDGPTRAALEAGAVVGRRFTTAEVDLLLAGTPEDGAAPEALDELARRGLLEPAPGGAPGSHQFRSGLLRDVAYRGLSKRRRATWHERLAARTGIGAALTAHHTEQAYLHLRELGQLGPRTRALRARAARALAEAGRHALARADLGWSAELHQRALRHSESDEPSWTTAALGLGETWLALGRAEEGGALLRKVLAVSARAGDRLAHAHARLQLASLDPEGDQGTAADAAHAAMPVFQAAGDRLGLARAQIRIAQDRQLAGRHRSAGRLLATALDHAVAADVAPERAIALGALGVSLWHGPTPAPEAIAHCRALLAEHGPGNATATVTLSYPLANLLALHGRTGEARACLATADRLAAGLGYAEVAGFAPLFAAGVEVLAGRPEAAEPLLWAAVQQCRAVGAPALLATASRELARLHLSRGA
ncbi:adenylate/guanylate cyclase domain-containing protein, partial [Streptomyces triticirhizae]